MKLVPGLRLLGSRSSCHELLLPRWQVRHNASHLQSAVAEWMSLLLAEAKHGGFDLRTREQVQGHALGHVQVKCRDEIPLVDITGVTDCKGLYDHVS
jgi:hypothetical protein